MENEKTGEMEIDFYNATTDQIIFGVGVGIGIVFLYKKEFCLKLA